MKIKKLEYPYPFKAWFALSNDPDHTTIDRWEKLHALIWEELQLPFADSIFTFSHNQHLPEQISLDKFGSQLLKHPYDTLHSWGDFRHAGNMCFSRNDALAAVDKVKSFGIHPLVWTDHSVFVGNFAHHSSFGSIPYTKDAAGYSYKNQKYSLDLACKMGIRYMWDGKLTPVVGQRGRSMGMSKFKLWLAENTGKFYSKLFSNISYTIDVNWDLNEKLYKRVKMLDGHELYFFRRYGSWRSADIDGFGQLLTSKMLNNLMKRNGACIMYTHLGKNEVSKAGEGYEIPLQTIEALKLLKSYYLRKDINLSPVSELLDYSVIRDNMVVDNKMGTIRFNADGLRYSRLLRNDLRHRVFSYTGQLDTHTVNVVVDDVQVDWYSVDQIDSDTFTLTFI